MKLLAFETSSEVASVVLDSDGVATERLIRTPRDQTRHLLAAIDALLGEGGLELGALDAIAFGRGPGSFTGLRLGAAIAQGLGASTGLALVPISSLAVIAQGAWRSEGVRDSLVGVDARMGEMYWAEYTVREGLATLCGSERLGPAAAVTVAHRGSWVALGNAFSQYRDALREPLAAAASCLPECQPGARDLLPLARAALAAGLAVEPEAALPVYLRGPEAWQRHG